MIQYKRLGTLLLCIFVAVVSLFTNVFAAGVIDTEHDMSLTISYKHDKTPLVGAKFNVYLVAEINKYGELTITEEYKQFSVDIKGKNDEAWRKLTSTLEAYTLRDKIAPVDSGKTDDDGMLHFPTEGKTLPQGLYLVLGERHTQNHTKFNASAFMVMLPSQNTEINDWVYDVNVEAKSNAKVILSESGGPGTVKRNVLKVWEDLGEEDKRPSEIAVQLLQDGEIFDTVVLNKENNWQHTWDNLSDMYDWLVTEETVPDGYVVSVVREGITFVVTNTYGLDIPDEPIPLPDYPDNPDNPDSPAADTPTTPDKPKLPQTGQLWWPVPALTALGLILVVIGVIRSRGICK